MKFLIVTFGLFSLMLVSIEGESGDENCGCPITGKRYYLYTDKKVDWMTANQICADNDQRLAAIMDASENDCLSALISKSTFRKNRFWTSGNDLDDDCTFTWRANGQRFRYTHWNTGEPSHAVGQDGQVAHCVDFFFTAKDPRSPQGTILWANVFCTNVHYVVCEN